MILRASGKMTKLIAFEIVDGKLTAAWHWSESGRQEAVSLIGEEAWSPVPKQHEPRVSKLLFQVLGPGLHLTHATFLDRVAFLCPGQGSDSIAFSLGWYREHPASSLLHVRNLEKDSHCQDNIVDDATAESVLQLTTDKGLDTAYRAYRIDVGDNADREWRYVATVKNSQSVATLYDLELGEAVCLEFPLHHSYALKAAKWLSDKNGQCDLAIGREPRMLMLTHFGEGAILGGGQEKRSLEGLLQSDDSLNETAAIRLLEWVNSQHGQRSDCKLPVRWTRLKETFLFEDSCIGMAHYSDGEKKPVDIILYQGKKPVGLSGEFAVHVGEWVICSKQNHLDAWALKVGLDRSVAGFAIRTPKEPSAEGTFSLYVITEQDYFAARIFTGKNETGIDDHTALALQHFISHPPDGAIGDSIIFLTAASYEKSVIVLALAFATAEAECESAFSSPVPPLGELQVNMEYESLVALIKDRASSSWRRFNDGPSQSALLLQYYEELLRDMAKGEPLALQGAVAQARAVSPSPGNSALWKTGGQYRYVVQDDSWISHNLLAGECQEIQLEDLQVIWRNLGHEACANSDPVKCQPVSDILFARFEDPLWFASGHESNHLYIDPRQKIVEKSRKNCRLLRTGN